MVKQGLTLLAAFFFATAPVFAQTSAPDDCTFRPQILDLADRILAGRTELPGFSPASFGSEAAYLTLRYGEYSTSQGLRFLHNVDTEGRRPPRNLANLTTTYAISRLGAIAGLSLGGGDPLNRFLDARPSVVRAIILADSGQSYFDLLQQVNDDPELAARPTMGYFRNLQAARSIIDQSDDFKLAFAQLAESRGEAALAGSVLASRRDITAYADFLNRYSQDQTIMNFAGEQAVFLSGFSVFHNDHPLELIRHLSISERYNGQLNFDIYKAGILGREIDFFSVTYNVTGRREIVTAARNYMTALGAGKITPQHDAEAAWLVIHQNLLSALGTEQVFRVLSGFDISTRHRHFAGSALQTMDWVVAKAAVAAFVRGETDTLPERPEILSNGIDWASWTRLALQSTSSPTPFADPLSEADAAIAVEILYLRGDIDDAINLAERDLSLKAGLTVYRDFMKRFDVQCAAVTDYPGKALLFGGSTLFRFPLRP